MKDELALVGIGVIVGAVLMVLALFFAGPPPSVTTEPTVLRRLELRLSDPLDRKAGERYRKFECREVPR